MKKIIVGFLIVALILSFVGCADTPEAAPKTESTSQASDSAGSEASSAQASESLPLAGKKVGFAHIVMSDEWCTVLADSITKQGLELGADLVNVQDANFELETQIKQFENFLAEQYSALFLFPISPESMEPYVQSAKDAGIPVIAVDGAMEGDPLVSHVVWDQAKTGRNLAEACLEYIDANIAKDQKVRFVYIDNKAVESLAIRLRAFDETLSAALGDRLVVVADRDATSREEAANVISSIAEPFDIIYCPSDVYALGAITSLEAAGLTSNDVVIFGCGGYGIECYNEMSKADTYIKGMICVAPQIVVDGAYDVLLRYLNGDTDIPDRINVDVPVMTHETLETYMPRTSLD